ncbi:MAG TPA: response regulator [Cyclobacteriaceae bacterium]|nr:response regulator [Cyclobacteriaceae bacterium]
MSTSVSILIIDDKRENIFAMEKLLERPERNFLSATNGTDGLKLALSKNIDLIILDVQMPEMDGFEVAQILKSNKRTKDVPIIFASAEKKERNSIMKGFEEGAVDYLSKPLDPELTKAKVSVLLKIQMQKKELIEKNNALEKAEVQIKQLNTDLQINLGQLEYINKELESFSYSVSHDLRAPLRAIIGYSKMIEEDFGEIVGADGKRLVSVVQSNANKMNKLIDGLLQFSKSGKMEVSKSEIDMDGLVQHVIHDICDSTQHPVKITVNQLYPAKADNMLITQVWMNLISNAIKYSSAKENPQIEIGSTKDDHSLIFFVKDNGAGFSMDYADKLFGVFQRLHSAEEFEGTGVGLAIVQRIINRHGGRVWAEAQVNKGATFYFSLPVIQ